MQAIMTEIVTITPELAKSLLQHRNVKNRHISERMLAIYAADMRDGRSTDKQLCLTTRGGSLMAITD